MRREIPGQTNRIAASKGFKPEAFFLGPGGLPYAGGILVYGCVIVGLLWGAWFNQEWRYAAMALAFMVSGTAQLLSYNFYGLKPPIKIAVVILLVQSTAIETVIQLDISRSLLFLYLFIPLRVLYYFGEVAGVWAGIITVLIYASQSWLYATNPQNYLINLSLWILALVFLFGRTNARQREDRQRARTEQLLLELENSHWRLKEYSEQAEELAATRERNHIAREIHDSLGHYLTAINIQIESTMVLQKYQPEETYQSLEEARRLVKEALKEVRRSVGALRNDRALFAFEPVLQSLLDEVRKNNRFRIQLSLTGNPQDYNYQVLITLYRVIQEGLNNIQKHAQASDVQIGLTFTQKEAHLTIQDDGRGFDPFKLTTLPQDGQPGGYGLVGVRERLELVGGNFHLKSSPNKGTCIMAKVPKNLLSQRRSGEGEDF